MFQTFRDLGVTTITLKHTGGTDHLSYDDVGLPGFQFIQDPLDYGTVTHHSDMDTYSHAVPEDLMQASAVIATLVYDIANYEEEMPRKPLPSATVGKVARSPHSCWTAREAYLAAAFPPIGALEQFRADFDEPGQEIENRRRGPTRSSARPEAARVQI